MFVDEVILKVVAGSGGDGCTAFRREKYIPMGGPYGGNGGHGSDIIFKVDEGLHTLLDLRYQKEIKGKTPNIRDFASAEELVVLINLEDTNADLTRQEVPKIERLKILREKAYRQLELLRKNQDTIEALKKNLIEDTETNG